jgi:hypothetical protein
VKVQTTRIIEAAIAGIRHRHYRLVTTGELLAEKRKR